MSTLSIDMIDLSAYITRSLVLRLPLSGRVAKRGCLPVGSAGIYQIVFMSGSLESGLLNPPGIERESMRYTPVAAA